VGFAIGKTVLQSIFAVSISMENRVERHSAKAHSKVVQERAARSATKGVI
jgi:hypothetical protein